MVFANDTDLCLRSAVELVNSAAAPDSLTSIDDLDGIFDRYGYTGRHDRSDAELQQVRAIRGELRDLLLGDPETTVALINSTLGRYSSVPRLVRHDAIDWHLHAVDDFAPLAHRMLVETAMAMIDVIRADETSRLTTCADDECDGIVLDLSRNRSRRYCSTTCGNRNAVAAYRARRAAD